MTEVYGHIIDEDRRKNGQRMEDAFYNRENLTADEGCRCWSDSKHGGCSEGMRPSGKSGDGGVADESGEELES